MFGKSLVFFLLGCAVAAAIPAQRNPKPALQIKTVENLLNVLLQETNNRLQKSFLATIKPFDKIHSSLIEASKNADKDSIEKIKKLSSIYKKIIKNGSESFEKVRDAVGKLVNQIQDATSKGIAAEDMNVYKETLNMINQYSIEGTNAAIKGLTQILLQWKNHVDGFLENSQIDSESEENNNDSGLLPNIPGGVLPSTPNVDGVSNIKEGISEGINSFIDVIDQLPHIAGKLSPIKLPNPGEVWNNIAGAVGVDKIFPKIPLPKLPVFDKKMFEKIGQKVGGHIGGKVDKFTNTVGGILNNAIDIIGK